MTEYHKIKCPNCGLRDSSVPLTRFTTDNIICPVCGAMSLKYKPGDDTVQIKFEKEETVSVKQEEHDKNEEGKPKPRHHKPTKEDRESRGQYKVRDS